MGSKHGWVGALLLAACATTAPQRSHGFVDNAGVRIEVIRFPAARQRHRHPVLLVHGMVARAQRWFEPGNGHDRLANELHARGFDVIALSLRGRGGSDCPASGWTSRAQSGDIEAVVRRLAPQGVHIVAHSQGTGYALMFAMRAPRLVHGFVAGDYAPGVGAVDQGWVTGVNARRDPGVLCATAAESILREQERSATAPEGLAWSVDLRPGLAEVEFPALVLDAADERWREENEAEWRPLAVTHLAHVGHDVYADATVVAVTSAFLSEADGLP